MMPPKRKRASDGDENSEEDDSQQTNITDNRTKNKKNNTQNKRFSYLKPSVRHVPERTIKSKWSTLPEPVQDKVRDMFRALERPVIVRNPNERKRIEAQAAVQAVVKKYVLAGE